MKKILTAIFVICLIAVFGITVFAEDAADAASEHKELVESLYNGIVPVTPDTTYSDLITMMEIVDESEGKMYTAKLVTFIELITQYYYEGLTKEEVYSRFVNAVDSIDINDMDATYTKLFTLFDRFSYYLTPEQAEEFFSPTASKGIGIKMAWHEAEETLPAGIYVEEVAVGSPAQVAGIHVGDRIVGFNGNDLRGLGFEALSVYISLVAADAPALSVTVERYGDTVTETTYNLERVVNVFSEYTTELYPEKNLVYFDINTFMNSSNIAIDLVADIDKAWNEGYRNVIIDLRDNSGGDVTLAAEVLSKFTPNVELMFYMSRGGNAMTAPFFSKGNGYSFDSVSVLVNEKTASSAEIFAYALNTMTDAFIVGTQTYGKGVAQSAFSFVDGAACGITSYVVYDRYGNTYNEKGVVPDVTVEGIIEKNTLPKGTPTLTALNYSKAVAGASNSAVKGLEVRLEAIGFMSGEKVDGVWDDATTRALMALQSGLGYTPTGVLDANTYLAINKLVDAYQRTYYYTYTAFDYAYRFVGFR